ncbi:MAG: UDP-N-acetylmuramate--L-alanine ligase [Actinomycetota bacterium]|jgi:UDP-N-acetylmuramate--alanine ligase|nr:MAG: murC [Acidimicrobiaceae bacterium]
MNRPQAPIDLSRPQRIHVVGVGGPGMSAIAIVLAEMGHTVSGSDIRERPILDRLRAGGVGVHVGHHRSHVDGCDAVTYSTAVPDRNVELDQSRAAGVTTLRRAGMLASICERARSLGVAGTHGKTTTSSMLMLILAEAGLRPSFIIGGDVTDTGTGAQWTGSDWLVVEADESDGTHLELPLDGTVVTNVEVDHLDHYGTFAAIRHSFDTYLGQVPGPKVLCFDDPVCRELADVHAAVTYGTGEGAAVRATDIEEVAGSLRFVVEQRGVRLGIVELPLRGIHNVRNATGAIALALEIGVGFATAAAALARFGGVARRFDLRGVSRGATLVDDYAHLPTEISTVLAAARSSGDGWQRVVAVFQPNRFNRMAIMWPDYADSFVDADLVVLTDIYPSGTEPIPGVTGKLVVNAVVDRHPEHRVVWLPRRQDLIDFVASELRPGDVCISMGCGDIASFPDEVIERRAERAPVDGGEGG